jgi:hypothetical protein
LNDLSSGVVAGKSSALYGIVLNEVLRTVLGKRPVPMLVPKALAQDGQSDGGVDSVLHRYLLS